MKMDWKTWTLRLDTLVIFRRMLEREVLSAFRAFAQAMEGDENRRVQAYCTLTDAVYRHGFDFSTALLEEAVGDENLYLQRLGRGEELPPELLECVERELLVLDDVARLTCEELRRAVGTAVPLPGFASSPVNFPQAYYLRTADVQKKGWGIYARSTMFSLLEGEVVPASPADTTTLASLSGYQDQRQQLLDNTRALLRGLPAANALLYGDAGTGKSSAVKAVANFLAPEGLRLIELQKNQLRFLPRLMETLQNNPLKFILFMDDLSFQRNDDDFNALKAALEGSSRAQADNVVIYATSNRRHLVRESFSDREGDDIHLRNTIQETLSLSDRFGLSIFFSSPEKKLYLQIVHDLARQKGICIEQEELDLLAERFAREKGGRSPRAARQFTDQLESGAFQSSPADGTHIK